MKDDLLKIVNNYGINNQQRKFWEESGELSEAITTHELKKSFEYEIPLTEIIGTKKHIAEELSDCFVMLKQFQYYYDIEDSEIEKIMEEKINRQLRRIEEENNAIEERDIRE